MINVLEWLERTAERTPDHTAFADNLDAMTFAQVRETARTIGSALARVEVPRKPIAVLASKSPMCVSTMFGIVYAGDFYCMLDERQPIARLHSIVEKLGTKVLIVDEAHVEQAQEAFGSLGIDMLSMSELASGSIDEQLLADRRAQAVDTDPLYVTFTSGSTGAPKGIVTSHRSVIDFITQFTDLFGITAEDQLGNQAPLDFDASNKDIYSALRTGATVNLIPREFFSVPAQLMDYLAERKVTVCSWAVSAMCFVSIMGGFEYREVPTIRLVVFSGELMPVKQLNVWRKFLPNTTYVNAYGPSETTCNCTYHILDRDYEPGEEIAAGRAFPNEKVFLLDDNDALIEEAGEVGEVCVSGTCLALGYCNDPEKTAAAFMQNPLNTAYPERMYRTGDLARYDEHGELFYVGRRDHQIKHMGQRIELGEIETVAQSLPGVERACCVYQERKKRIWMFFAGSCGKDELAAMLHDKLPLYMVPGKLKQLDALPMTKNGKIDRAALADSLK